MRRILMGVIKDRNGTYHAQLKVPERLQVTGENFQIINGAQTIGALKSAKDLSSETEVLLRITQGESVKTEKGFNADVIRFNNTQNIIKSSDFRSNDPVQLWLEKRFNDLRPRGAQQKRIVYVRKRSLPRGISPFSYLSSGRWIGATSDSCGS
jgi:hypothetical protein